MKKLVVVVLLMGVALFVGCGGGSKSGGGGNGGNTVTLVGISITPAAPSIALKATQQFKATGSFSDGTTKDLTSVSSWLSSNGAFATINTAGLATAVAPGTTTITASSAGVTGTTSLTVANALVSIAVTPSSVSIAPNATQQFTAIGTFADGSVQNPLAGVTWSASPGATITAGGLATAITPNASVTIMATQGAISGTATMTVTNPLVSIAVTPATASVAPGFTQAFTAKGTYADGSTNGITSTVTWASSAPPTVATISNTLGSQGIATGVAQGTSSITASLGSIVSPPATLTVTNATLTSITVTPANQQITFNTTQQYLATGHFSDSSNPDITTSVNWTSSNPSQIFITPATGLATGVNVTNTPVTVTATEPKSGKTGTTTATVILPSAVSIVITPSTPNTLAQGTSRPYTATATLANGSTLNVTNLSSWSSSDSTVATVVSNTGLVRAKAVATATPVDITVSYTDVNNRTVSATLHLNVTAATVSTITVTHVPSIPVGVQQRFNATAAFSDGTTQDISSNVGWSSSIPATATVNGNGLATSLSQGVTTIAANFVFNGQNVTGSAPLTVNAAIVSTVSISPSSTVLPVGKAIAFQAIAKFNDGTSYFVTTMTPNTVWTSSDPTLVKFTTPGVATTLQPGPPVTITATYTQVSGTTVTSNNASVIVTQFPLVSVVVAPLTAKVPVGVTTQFLATGVFSDGSTQSLTNYVTWASNPSTIATINNGISQQGIAIGVSPGQASITAVFAGVVSPQSTLTVSTATIQTLTITPNPASGQSGSQLQFKAVGHFDDGSAIDLTAQVNWSSQNVTVATISSAGVANIVGSSGQTTLVTATITQNGVTVSDSSNLTVQ